MRIKQKKNFFFGKKNSKWPTQKKCHFSKSPILKIFLPKFHRFVLGLVGLNDAKGINGCFWAYVGQPHDHIRKARSMPFASCNPTNPMTNLWNFHEKILRIGDFEKWPFLKNGHFGFFFKKKNFFFALFSWKSVQIFMVEWMGWNFDVFSGFQKIPWYA